MSARVVAVPAFLLAVAFTATGCGDGDDQAQVPATVVTVTETASAPAPAPATSSSAPAPASSAPQVPAAADGEVPNVVGLDHQLAQDTMQAAGFYNLSEEDATGQGRLLLVDRNWVVVSQEPAGGTKAPKDTTIILRSKKDGE